MRRPGFDTRRRPETVSYTHLDVYKRQIPVPFVNTALLQTVASSSGNLIGYINMLSGGAFSRAMLFACLLYTSRCV